jgi:hypothetical protein
MNLYNHGLTCSACGNGGSNPFFGPLNFNVTLAGLTAANFVTSPFFAADVISSNGNTGLIDSGPGTVTPVVPEPSSIVLLGSGMVGLAVFMRRKIQR